MTVLRVHLAAIALFALASCAAPGTNPPAADAVITGDKLEALLLELQTNLAAGPRPPPATIQLMVSLRQAIVLSNFNTADQNLANLRTAASGNPAATVTLDHLAAAVRTLRVAADRAIEAEIDGLIAEIRAKVTARAAGREFDPLLDRITRSLTARTTNPYFTPMENARVSNFQTLRNVVMLWQDYLLRTAQGQFDLAANAIESIANNNRTLSVLANSELIAIQSEAAGRLQAARETRVAAARARLNDLLARFPALIDAARTARDLDPLLVELPAMRMTSDANYSGNFPASYHEINDLVERLQRFTPRWQDYLGQVAAGNLAAAQLTLTTLAADAGYAPIYPRSHLVERLNAQKNDPEITVSAAGMNPSPPRGSFPRAVAPGLAVAPVA